MADFQRSDLDVESRLLLRKAPWCGIVFALGVVITSLNFLPPVGVSYRLESRAMVSPVRLEQLKQLASEHEKMPLSEGLPARLLGVRVLDDGSTDLVNNASNEKLILVAIDSHWLNKCNEEQHSLWLERLSKADVANTNETETARLARQARWALAATEHYVAQNQYLNETKPSSTRTTFELASTQKSSPGVSATLAAQRSPLGPTSELEEQLAAAQSKLSETELAWQQEIEQSSGTIRVAGAPEASAVAGTIPLWMAVSVLVLGLASGTAAGWIQHRLQSGGAYDPTFVSRQLALQGVPVAGEVELPGEMIDGTDWIELAGRKASDASRRTARQLTQISEWAVAFWCIMIVARIVLDPLWRNVLLDSPLAAFGRLLAGMP